MATTEQLIRMAEKGLDDRHPAHNFPVEDGAPLAVGYALLALVDQQQLTNSQLAGINISLDRIARAMEQRTTPAPPTEPAEPKRRRWLPSRRNS